MKLAINIILYNYFIENNNVFQNQDSLWSAFGDYVGCLNADSLMFEKNGGDAAKKHAWAYHFEENKIGIFK